MFLAFMDWSKAYDTIWREELWETLREKGLGVRSVGILQELYRNTKRRIRLPDGYTDWLLNDVGVRQGCSMSPVLFALYISDFNKYLENTEGGTDIHDAKVKALIYADDIVLIAENDPNMKRMLQFQ